MDRIEAVARVASEELATWTLMTTLKTMALAVTAGVDEEVRDVVEAEEVEVEAGDGAAAAAAAAGSIGAAEAVVEEDADGADLHSDTFEIRRQIVLRRRS